jgi:hypothetical protein
MKLHEKNITADERWRLAEGLCEAALVDTVYGDLYMQRARDFLAPVLSEARFAAFQLLETEALNLPNRIWIAMNQGKWRELKDLSARMASLRRTLAESEDVRKIGEKIFKPGEPPLDPFSPGLQRLAKSGDPQVLLRVLSEQLERLQRVDPEWQDFYAARRSAMAGIKTYSPQAPKEVDLSRSQLKDKALEALNKGEFANLEKIADLMEKEEPGRTEGASGSLMGVAETSPDLTFQFPQEILKRAQALGLAPMRMEAGSRHLHLSPEELAPLYSYLWTPAFTDGISHQGAGWRKKELPLPADAAAVLRDLLELFALHPFVNSAGARYVGVFAEEDVLVEDFAEPDPGTKSPASALLSALGFDDRRGLSRIRLEKALFDRGNAIVGDIGLDARTFRLVCIPPDVYGRVGLRRGWGRKSLWTHFDGYLVKMDGKFLALAGGDVNFGGLYDLVGVSREYDSDRILARFAVIQRRRMEAVEQL